MEEENPTTKAPTSPAKAAPTGPKASPAEKRGAGASQSSALPSARPRIAHSISNAEVNPAAEAASTVGLLKPCMGCACPPWS